MENKYYCIETFGCQMNVHESEKLAGILVKMGYAETKERAQAHVIVFNTCCIRDTAEKKIFGNIGELKILKRQDKSRIIVIVGCMTQQEGMAEVIATKFPFVDIILGTSNIHLLEQKIVELEERRLRKRGKIIDIDTKTFELIVDGKNVGKFNFVESATKVDRILISTADEKKMMVWIRYVYLYFNYLVNENFMTTPE